MFRGSIQSMSHCKQLKSSIAIVAMTLSVCSVSHANPFTTYSEISGEYLSLCEGLNQLQRRFCPKVMAPTLPSCINDLTSFLPSKHQSQFQKMIQQVLPELKQDSHRNIERGFNKTIQAVGTAENACLAYGSSLLTAHNQKLIEAKRASSFIR